MLADVSGADRILARAGPAGLGFLALAGVLAALARSTRGVATLVCATALLAIPARCSPVGPTLPLAGLQLDPEPMTDFRWHQKVVDAYLAAEPALPGGVVVWPEASYPLRERLRSGQPLSSLPAPAEHARVLGMHASMGFFRVANAVVVQAPGEDGVAFRYKQRLAPVHETKRLLTPVDTGPTLLVRGEAALLPVCYEVLDRRMFTGAAARLGISISADGFDPSGQASKLLTRATWLRALECSIPFARVSNGTYSAAFDRDGRTLGQLGRGRGTLLAQLELPAVATPCGRAHRLTLLALAVLLTMLALIRGLADGRRPAGETRL